MSYQKIVHRKDKETGEEKVVSHLFYDDLGNLIGGRTFKYYDNYYQKVEKMTDAIDRERFLKNLPLLFKHECEIIALANSKRLPAVTLVVSKRPENQIEMEYLESVTLLQRLESPDTTMAERRHLITAAIRCMHKFHTAGIFLGDPHPSNFLITSTGLIIFCDFGNAFSPEELPFNTPPLATGNLKTIYYSDAQDTSFKADHSMDHNHCAAPYSAGKLASNRLEAKDDFFVFAHHTLQIQIQVRDKSNNPLVKFSAAQLFDPELNNSLERIERGKFATADEILMQMNDTAPVGMQPTPEIDSYEEIVIPKKPFRFSQPIWTFNPAISAKNYMQKMGAPVVAIGICIIAGLAIGGIYKGYRHFKASNIYAESSYSQPSPSNADKSAAAESQPAVPVETTTPPLPTKPSDEIGEKQPEKVAEQLRPAVIEYKQGENSQLKAICKSVDQRSKPVDWSDYRDAIVQLAHTNTPESSKLFEAHLKKMESIASSPRLSQASNGIRALHIIAGVKSSVSRKAFAAIGDVIQQTIESGPSEDSQQKLELLAKLGNVRAHHELGVWLESGKGLSSGRDLAAAYRHYVAASRKVVEAAKAVVRMESVAPDMVKARSTSQEGFRLMQAVADRPSNTQSQWAVGCIYAEGKYGVPVNLQLAKEYLTRSAQNGFVPAKTALKYYRQRGVV